MKQGWQDQKVHKQEIIASTIHPYACFSLLLCTYQLIMVDVFVECGMWETFVQVVPQLSRWFGFISFNSIALLLVIFCTPQKPSVGMYYSRCDYLLFVYFLIPPSLLHSSILFNCFYTCVTCSHISCVNVHSGKRIVLSKYVFRAIHVICVVP